MVLQDRFGALLSPRVRDNEGGTRISGTSPQLTQQSGQKRSVKRIRGQAHPEAAAGSPEAGLIFRSLSRRVLT